MSKAKYANLVFGLKVLSEDANSFNLNEKGYKFISLIRENISSLPKKKEIEEIGCSGIITNIEKLYIELVKFNSSVSDKEERKKALQSIIYYEELICGSFGMNLREVDGEVVKTETITVNQYNFFASCFAIQHASKKERLDSGNVIDVTSINSFKKAVLFGLSEACANDGTIYAISGKKKVTIDRLEKSHNKPEKSKK